MSRLSGVYKKQLIFVDEIGEQNLEEFAEKWNEKYAYISTSWRDDRGQLLAFFDLS